MNSSNEKEKVIMNTITKENSKMHLQRSGRCKSSGRLPRSFYGFGLVLFALVALASSAQAWVVGITACDCSNITIQVDGFTNFPPGALTVTIGGTVAGGGTLVSNTYDYASQTMVLTRPGWSGRRHLLDKCFST